MEPVDEKEEQEFTERCWKALADHDQDIQAMIDVGEFDPIYSFDHAMFLITCCPASEVSIWLKCSMPSIIDDWGKWFLDLSPRDISEVAVGILENFKGDPNNE